MGPLASGLLIAGASTAAYPLIERLIYGSREDQMREQMELQDRFEQERMGRMAASGEMGDLAGLVGGGRMDLAQLMNEAEQTQYLADVGQSLGRLGRSRNRQMDELDAILAGETARIAQLQSPRTLTPLEIIQMVEGGFG